MRSKITTIAAAIAILGFGAAAPMTALAYPGSSLAQGARIPLARARVIALAARPGTIIAQELEREGGGSGLRYSFDIRSARVVYEVGIDANTGAVLENAPEGARPD